MLEKLLITGVGGNLGTVCREHLKPLAKTIRLSDNADIGAAGPNEEIVLCDLGDKAAVEALVEGCDGIVHFGGQSVEANWETVRNANIDGMYHLYEAARKSSVTQLSNASRRALRCVQGIWRGACKHVLRQVRDRNCPHSHRLLFPRTARPSDAVHLDEH